MTAILLFHTLEKYYHYKTFIYFQDLRMTIRRRKSLSIPAEPKNVFLLLNIPAVSGAQPTTYSVGCTVNFPTRRAAVSEAGHRQFSGT